MGNVLPEIALHLGIVAAMAVVAATCARTRLRPGWLLAALALMLLRDALVMRGYGLLPELVPGAWNWTGKLLVIVVLLPIAAAPAFGWRRCGLTLRQARGAPAAWWLFGAVAALLFGLAFHLGDGADDAATIAFQWTMPGLEEELFYRGVLLLALCRAVGDGDRPWLDIGWGGVLSSIAFGLGHALFWRADGPAFDAMAMLMTAAPALLLVWFRHRTGSLVLPVLAHNVANGAFTLM